LENSCRLIESKYPNDGTKRSATASSEIVDYRESPASFHHAKPYVAVSTSLKRDFEIQHFHIPSRPLLSDNASSLLRKIGVVCINVSVDETLDSLLIFTILGPSTKQTIDCLVQAFLIQLGLFAQFVIGRLDTRNAIGIQVGVTSYGGLARRACA